MTFIKVRPIIKKLDKLIQLPSNAYLDPTTLGTGAPTGSDVLRGDGSWGPAPSSLSQVDYNNTFLLMGA